MNHLGGEEELRVVFQLCQPNPDGLISLSKLQLLLDQHTNQLHGNSQQSNVVRTPRKPLACTIHVGNDT